MAFPALWDALHSALDLFLVLSLWLWVLFTFFTAGNARTWKPRKLQLWLA